MIKISARLNNFVKLENILEETVSGLERILIARILENMREQISFTIKKAYLSIPSEFVSRLESVAP